MLISSVIFIVYWIASAISIKKLDNRVQFPVFLKDIN